MSSQPVGGHCVEDAAEPVRFGLPGLGVASVAELVELPTDASGLLFDAVRPIDVALQSGVEAITLAA
ncbi:MAG: hypothetical protein M3N57_01750 [Actinomycetota bacterium]|nr:hypothetical protein [Actinomycetota bacterium]